MANQLKEKQKKLKKLRTRNIILNLVCICLAGSGLWWTATYFWRYVNYEVTNDAFVDQYVAPLNVRASGYIRKCVLKSINMCVKAILYWCLTTVNIKSR